VPKIPTMRTVTTAECQFQMPDRGNGGRKPETNLYYLRFHSRRLTPTTKGLARRNGEHSPTRPAQTDTTHPPITGILCDCPNLVLMGGWVLLWVFRPLSDGTPGENQDRCPLELVGMVAVRSMI